MSILTQPVGFIGLGAMGAGMAASLLRGGVALTVYNRSAAKAEPHKAAGAKVAASVAEIAETCDVIFLSLPTVNEIREVLFGAEGIAGKLKKGTVVIDTSTISAADTREIAGKLGEGGVDFIDAPVSGGPPGAAAGTLSVMVGGPDEVVAKVKPLIEKIAKTIVHVGGHGAGQLCKTASQVCLAGTMLGVAEAMALCLKAEVDPMRVREALLGGAAKSVVLENHVLRLLNPSDAPGFRTVLMRKDLRVALDTLRSLGVYAPQTAAAEQLFSAFVENGFGDEDWPRIGFIHQEMSGLKTPHSK